MPVWGGIYLHRQVSPPGLINTAEDCEWKGNQKADIINLASREELKQSVSE